MLCDPARKRAYDATTASELFIDEQMRERLEQSGVPDSALVDLPEPTDPPPVSHYDYFSRGQHPQDRELADRWYEALVATAPVVGYRRPIRVLLHDDDPAWKERGGILLVPRSWQPSAATAFALFVCLIRPNHTLVAN